MIRETSLVMFVGVPTRSRAIAIFVDRT
jgi:hypothetical protein